MRILERTLRVGLVLIALSGAAAAQSVPVGFLSWDLVFPGNAGAFDFTNLTGPNGVALGDPTLFPISSTVNLTSLTLVVNFANGSSATYLPSAVPPYFSPDPDGESLDGTAIPIAGTNPLPTSAKLTGTFNPTAVTLAGGGTTTISPTFTVTISPDTGNSTLADGDYGVVFASFAQAPQTISVTTKAPASAAYGSSFSVAATASSGLKVAIAATGSCAGSGGGSANITMTSSSGSCSVTFNQAGNASYLPAAQITESVKSSKAVLTATANSLSKVAGAANPALTYKITGLVNEDTSAVVNGTATLTTTATSTSPIGPYPITFSTEALTATNYTFTYVAGTLTVGGGTLLISPASGNFGSVEVGTTSPVISFTVTNDTTSTMGYLGFTNLGEFYLQPGTCHLVNGEPMLKPGQSCVFTAVFKPTKVGAVSGNLSIQTSSGTFNVPMTGTGATLVISPASGNFGSVAVGTTSPMISFTVTNDTTSTMGYLGFTNLGEFLSSSRNLPFGGRRTDAEAGPKLRLHGSLQTNEGRCCQWKPIHSDVIWHLQRSNDWNRSDPVGAGPTMTPVANSRRLELESGEV